MLLHNYQIGWRVVQIALAVPAKLFRAIYVTAPEVGPLHPSHASQRIAPCECAGEETEMVTLWPIIIYIPTRKQFRVPEGGCRLDTRYYHNGCRTYIM
ncbi:hypothetical protein NDU88_000321 [Pleurodeles waltl]|uniref:Secreted protein n=1 Tax=Pleurodeles waltl TaxID=8319 RepID=A0AAV7P3L9_PLEWA|nr:hypothetical protein NDU88_000321 [Pleurodeles waltl]